MLSFESQAWRIDTGQLSRRAKQDGGGRRTRTFEVIRRLIYSQLPLPLGTLPRSNPIASPSAEMATKKARDDVRTQGPDHGLPVGRVYAGRAMAKSTKAEPKYRWGLKLPLSGTRETSLADE